MTRRSIRIEQIDDLLPQTQCGDCSYVGCEPYARAIIENNEALDRCTPGGITTLQNLSNLLDEPASSKQIADMAQKQKPPMLAVIDESACIGCVKCIKACPVDAIVGAAKKMHTIISSECTGCELCVAPCPMDCIDMRVIREPLSQERSKLARKRFNQREERLQKIAQKRDRSRKKFDHLKSNINTDTEEVAAKKAIIQAAIARHQQKRKNNHHHE